jgi:hypothetical protein
LAISALTWSVLARTDIDALAAFGCGLVEGSGRPLFDPPNSGVASLAMAADGEAASSLSRPDVDPGGEAPPASVPLVEPTNGGLGRNGRRAVASGGG